MRPGDPVRVDIGGNIFNGVLYEYTMDYDHARCDREVTLKVRMTDEMYQGRGVPVPGVTVRNVGAFSDHCSPMVPIGRPGPTKTTTKKLYPEVQVDKYEAIIIRDRESKRAKVYLLIKGKTSEDDNELYLAPDGKSEVERAPGSEMPLYASYPDEVFIPLIQGAHKGDYSDAGLYRST